VLYSTFVFLHSVIRWLIVGAAIWTLVKPLEKKPGLLLVIAVDTQILIGLLMYLVVSPITQLALANMKVAMKDHALRFWAVEHPFAMILVLAAVHGGRVAARRAKDEDTKKRRVVMWTAIALILVLVGMPWPFLAYGRPLLPHF
jgi:hypothetical protein